MIDYETIAAATQGDPVAAEAVLDYFDPYIDRLCTHAFVDDARCLYDVDTLMKTQLQGKLIRATLAFEA